MEKLDSIAIKLKKEMIKDIIANEEPLNEMLVKEFMNEVDADDVIAFGEYKKNTTSKIKTTTSLDSFQIELENVSRTRYDESGNAYEGNFDYAEVIETGKRVSPSVDEVENAFFYNIKAWLQKKVGGEINDSYVFAVINNIKKKTFYPRGRNNLGILTETFTNNLIQIESYLEKILKRT